MHEGIPILNYLVPKEFIHENGKLTGVMFEKVKAEYDDKGRRKLVPTGEPDQHFDCDDVLVAVGQENAFPWIERDIGIEFDEWDMPMVDPKTMRVDQPEGVLRRRRGVRPEEHHLGGRARPRGRDLDRQAAAAARTSTTGPLPHGRRSSARRWASTSGATTTTSRSTSATGCRCATRSIALKDIKAEVELGFDAKLAFAGGAALPQLRRADGVRRTAVHRVRRLRRHLPDGLHHLHARTARKPTCARG